MSSFKSHFPKTDALLQSAIEDSVFSSYAVGVLHQSVFIESYKNCGNESLFDLASLSKVLSTTTLIALAVDQEKLSLETPVQEFFPEFPGAQVTLAHLLNHCSGLPAWLALHENFHDKKASTAEVREYFKSEIFKSWNSSDFQKKCIYSDLDFMLLGWILEKKFNTFLDALFQEWIVFSTGFENLQYIPITPDIVPTEDCPWRKRVLRGEVHDDNCFVLGGVAGHAGLFGSLTNVIYLAKIWLDAFDGKTSLLSKNTAKTFWEKTFISDASFKLGWDSVSKENSSAGSHFSPSTRGHLGFTGTSLWIDPEKKLIVSLLSNRVYPTRKNEKIKSFRPRFHDTLLVEMGY